MSHSNSLSNLRNVVYDVIIFNSNNAKFFILNYVIGYAVIILSSQKIQIVTLCQTKSFLMFTTIDCTCKLICITHVTVVTISRTHVFACMWNHCIILKGWYAFELTNGSLYSRK